MKFQKIKLRLTNSMRSKRSLIGEIVYNNFIYTNLSRNKYVHITKHNQVVYIIGVSLIPTSL